MRNCSLGSRHLFLMAGLFWWTFGCGANTNVGPIAVPENFSRSVNASVDLRGEAIRQYGRVQWYPGVDTHEEWMRLAPATVDGVVVLTDTRVLFLTWNGEQYEKSREILYVDAKDVRRKVWTTTQRIVIESANGTADSFAFFSNNGVGVSVPPSSALWNSCGQRLHRVMPVDCSISITIAGHGSRTALRAGSP
jgi:hypothetical protein